MTDFSHLSAYQPDQTAEYTLPFENPASLVMVHAGQSNRPYTEAVARLTTKYSSSGGGKGGRATAIVKQLDINLSIDREVFPRHVIRGWTGILDTDHAPVEFSYAECVEFLSALPDWIMRSVSAFASVPENFTADSVSSLDEPIRDDDVEAQAGN